MRRTLAAGLLPLAAALALASPAHAEDAQTTINQLRAQGVDVRISRVGNAPLSECTVSGVRSLPAPAQQFFVDDDDFNVFTVVPRRKVAVSLVCN
ncbi:hypothetical protein [Mycolicibacterium parafortuitum]|uniref:Uncharacterized protein n=1 Tax=Mycolicibacterium parafortuitum TaxID=39692 RepID=A0A375YR64_MYCPF|nr:hypothetical protein [Mycolicibacterium parafortuitum]ORB29476.1 hypothetical protein BST38_14615 [Mycolicibacterium parafortuitum]SRX83645.1 hypothetical protein MPP7335_05426 [Mycolicibacterium parafortuitum]